MEDTFEQGLFAMPTADGRETAANRPPKCKRPNTRAAAFGLLTELAQGCRANNAALAELLLPHHTDPKFLRKVRDTSGGLVVLSGHSNLLCVFVVVACSHLPQVKQRQPLASSLPPATWASRTWAASAT